MRRHKTLGVFVPLWRPGPCKNPECRAYEAEAEPAHDGERTGGRRAEQSGS